jgi:hypothetical protein
MIARGASGCGILHSQEGVIAGGASGFLRCGGSGGGKNRLGTWWSLTLEQRARRVQSLKRARAARTRKKQRRLDGIEIKMLEDREKTNIWVIDSRSFAEKMQDKVRLAFLRARTR